MQPFTIFFVMLLAHIFLMDDPTITIAIHPLFSQLKTLLSVNTSTVEMAGELWIDGLLTEHECPIIPPLHSLSLSPDPSLSMPTPKPYHHRHHHQTCPQNPTRISFQTLSLLYQNIPFQFNSWRRSLALRSWVW